MEALAGSGIDQCSWLRWGPGLRVSWARSHTVITRSCGPSWGRVLGRAPLRLMPRRAAARMVPGCSRDAGLVPALMALIGRVWFQIPSASCDRAAFSVQTNTIRLATMRMSWSMTGWAGGQEADVAASPVALGANPLDQSRPFEAGRGGELTGWTRCRACRLARMGSGRPGSVHRRWPAGRCRLGRHELRHGGEVAQDPLTQ